VADHRNRWAHFGGASILPVGPHAFIGGFSVIHPGRLPYIKELSATAIRQRLWNQFPGFAAQKFYRTIIDELKAGLPDLFPL